MFFTVDIQVITSRLMEQLSEPAVLLALQTYFPDMFLVRLLSLRRFLTVKKKAENACGEKRTPS